jgi:type VII secretion-associated serine protease mycosin
VAGCAAVVIAALPSAPAAWADGPRDAQWHLRFLRVPTALSYSRGGGVVVGLVDSGVAARHPDLAGNVLPGTDLDGGGGDGRVDDEGHGTGMAGLIAAHGRGERGALGIAPEARILPVRTARFALHVLGREAQGVDWAVRHGARVICLAFTANDTAELRRAVAGALAADVVVVAAAGNRPELLEVGYPAAYPGVVAVAGVDRTGEHAPVSVTGAQVVLSAPATGILSTAPDGGYRSGTGTSDAAAIVAGVAALVRARFPQLSAPEVVHRLTATAVDKGVPGRDAEYGYGIVDPVAALAAAVAPLDGSAEPPAGSASPAGVPRAAGTGAATGARGHRHRALPLGWLPLLLGVLVAAAVSGAVAARRRAR